MRHDTIIFTITATIFDVYFQMFEQVGSTEAVLFILSIYLSCESAHSIING